MSLKKSDFEPAVRLIDGAESFVVATHARPDADTIGSALALARGLTQLGKRVIILSADGVPETCKYLSDAQDVVTETSERGFDVGVVCDAGGVDRTDAAADALKSAKALLIIDHHASGQDDPVAGQAVETVYLADVKAAATAEVVFELLHELEVLIEPLIAEQLMAGIVGDTGAFRFTNVTPKTFEIAARLTSLGASPSTAAREIFENRSLVNTRLLGAALVSLRTEEGGKIVWSRVTREDFARCGGTDNDTDSIVNQLRSVRGAEVGVLFREIGENEVRVSLRSRGKADVNQVARTFDGGGHVSASGCTLKTGLEEAESAVLAEVRKWMAS